MPTGGFLKKNHQNTDKRLGGIMVNKILTGLKTALSIISMGRLVKKEIEGVLNETQTDVQKLEQEKLQKKHRNPRR